MQFSDCYISRGQDNLRVFSFNWVTIQDYIIHIKVTLMRHFILGLDLIFDKDGQKIAHSHSVLILLKTAKHKRAIANF